MACLVLCLGCSSGGRTAASGQGGSPGAGGSGTGSGTGGASSTGGASATGGTSATGGANATGGTNASGGRAGTGGAASGGSAGASSGDPSVLERNNHPSRDAHFIQPTLTAAAAAKMALDTTFNAVYTGAVMGSPLYFAGGPGGKGVFIVVTTGNDVYAFDETTGATVWTKNLGSPAAKSGVTGCDGLDPLGVISTPVIDARTGTLYVAGAVGDADGISAHEVWALSLENGAVQSGYPVNVSQALGFDPTTHNQRGALSMVGHIVYVPYGGHTGDCVCDMHGRVVAIDTSTSPPAVSGWQSGGQGEAIWAPGGMASAGDGVFAATGNRFTSSDNHDDSEEVIHVRGMGTLDKSSGSKDFFFPSDWKTKDQRDFDLGAVNPVIVSLPGSTGPALIATSKDGNGFIFDTADLGKGPLATFDVTNQGMYVRAVPTTYVAGSKVFYAIAVESAWANCPGGTASGSVLMGFAISPSLPLAPSVAWCATYSVVPKGTDEVTHWGGPGAPGLISTTTNGSSDALVWYMNGGNQLVALDGATGAEVFRDAAASCGSVRKWTSPIAVKGHIVAAADGRLCSWSPH